MLEWIAGAIASVIFALIGVIWRATQNRSDQQDKRMDAINKELEQACRAAILLTAEVKANTSKCTDQQRDKLGTGDIRQIFREELKSFEARIKAEILSSIKLSLLEDGYIEPQNNSRKKKNHANET